MNATFIHYDLKLINPEFDSDLTDLVIGLDHLRKKSLGGTVWVIACCKGSQLAIRYHHGTAPGLQGRPQ